MRENVPNMLQILRDNGYSLNVFESSLQNTTSTQYLPAKIPYCPPYSVNEAPHDNYSHGKNLAQYLDGLEIRDNSLTLLQFSDFHSTVGNCLDMIKPIRERGLKTAADILACIRSKLEIDDFDLVVFYSDHGFLSADKRKGLTLSEISDPQLLLSASRSQIMMYLRRKGDNSFSMNDKLSCIMDVFPTVLNFCGLPYDKSSIEGIDLFSSEAYDVILIEDYAHLAVRGGEVNIWAARTEKGLACVDPMMRWTADYSITEDEKKKFDSMLSEKATYFAEQKKAAPVLRLDENVSFGPLLCYDGSRGKRVMAKRIRDLMKSIGKLMSRLMTRTAKILLR